MLAVFHNFDNVLYVKEVPMPVRADQQIMVKISYCCLGDSEAKIISGNDNSENDNYYSSCLESNGYYGVGYEASGIVVDTCQEAAAAGLDVGTPVCIHPKLFCGKCHYCKSGRENFCIDSQNTMRMMREYIVVDYNSVYPLNDMSSLLFGSFAYPVACALHAIDHANISMGQNVAIMGNSFISLIVTLLARNRGAKVVTALGLDPQYNELIVHHGANHAFSLKSPDDLVQAIKMTNDYGYDVVLEASHFFSSEEIAMSLLGRGGTIVFFSQASINANIRFNFYELFWKEAKIKASYGCPYSFTQAISSLQHMNLRFLEDNVYDLSMVQQAFEDANYGRCLKAIIRFS